MVFEEGLLAGMPVTPVSYLQLTLKNSMSRPIKWHRDLHTIRERALHARTETWSRVDIERLFGVARATAQTLMRTIGEIQPVGGAHFVQRITLLNFLKVMIEATDFDEAFRARSREAEAPPHTKPLRVSLPADLRSVTLHDLPSNILLSFGKLEIQAKSAIAMLESLALLAQAMQNDPERIHAIFNLPQSPPETEDDDLKQLSVSLRGPGTL